jgi:hypothetical protein
MPSWQKCLSLAWAAFILVPLIVTGITGEGPRWIPWRLHGFWNYTSLFSHKVDEWPSYHVQVQTADGRWQEVPHGPPFNHRLFGKMTRLDLVCMNFSFINDPDEPDDTETAGQKRLVLRQVCEAIGEAHNKGNSESEYQAVRLLRILRPVSLEGPPARPWSTSLPEDWPDFEKEILFEHPLNGAEPVRPFGS